MGYRRYEHGFRTFCVCFLVGGGGRVRVVFRGGD